MQRKRHHEFSIWFTNIDWEKELFFGAPMPKPQSRMKLLVRSKAVCHDDISDHLDPEFPLESPAPLSSFSSFISDSIFPSPFPISREEAIKESVGHFSGRDDENSLRPNSTTFGDKLQNHQDYIGLSSTETITGEENDLDVLRQDVVLPMGDLDSSLIGKNTATPRREMEKPPRMQKQRSQDRLLKQHKTSLDSDAKRENLSRESSVECVDSTGVDVHEFLINTLQSSQRDRVILLKLEHDMMSFVNDKTIDFMKFPPMTSYHRMLVHRVAAYFGMDHNVDETGKSVIINKTSSTRIPETRFTEHFDPRQMEQVSGRRDDDMRRRSILKRTSQSRSFDRDDIKGRSLWKDNRQRSIEEREEEYEKIRARIFNQEGNPSSPMYGRQGLSSIAAARMASWTERPWNSTDMESLPSMRMPLARPLTTRASSYSSISVLPRHNSATSVKTGSSSSVNSMNGSSSGVQAYPHNRQPMGNPRPPTPVRRVGDNGNGTLYYHMQQQNQDPFFETINIEDDIQESWFEMSDSPEPQSLLDQPVVVPANSSILLAVPLGVILPPETVLCHPITGMPYLSPEGYQLIYQSGPGGGDGSAMSSSHVAQYYQMPLQPSPQHPGMIFPQGQAYGPYQESPSKPGAGNIGLGTNSGEYSGLVAPISSYQQNIAITSAAYNGVPGQQNVSYAYQPSPAPLVYAPAQQIVASPNSGSSTSQPNVHIHPMAYNPVLQGKQQSSVVYGSQNVQPVVQQQVPVPSNFQSYLINQHANPTGPGTHPRQNTPLAQQGGMPKDGGTPKMNAPIVTPRPLMGHHKTMMQLGSQSYQGYQPRQIQAIYSPPTVQVHPVANSMGSYQHNPQEDIAKSSAQSQDTTSDLDKQLSEKMQAIMLKNMQQQGASSDKSTESAVTVSTSVSPQTNPVRVASHHTMPDAANPVRMSNVPVAQPLRHVSEQQGPQTLHPYANTLQQQQTMQVYFMPTNNQVPGGPSYRTYSQFMTQPQTPHVMGPGVHFVYLNPPMGGVVGMEGNHGAAAPNTQMLHNQPHQQFVQQGSAALTNANNNNIQMEPVEVHHSQHSNITRESVHEPDGTMSGNQNNQTPKETVNGSGSFHEAGSEDVSTSSSRHSEQSKADHVSELPTNNDVTSDCPAPEQAENVNSSSTANTINQHDGRGKFATAKQPSFNQAGFVQTAKGQVPNPADTSLHLTGQQAMSNPQNQLLGSNIPQDFRVPAINVAPGTSYTPGMVSQYPVYPGMNSSTPVTPYVKYYLPATAPRGQKLSDVNMYPTQAVPSPSPGVIAVQLPNQNQIQFVPASMPPPNPIYYAPHNHMTNDYTLAPITSKAIYTDEAKASTGSQISEAVPSDSRIPDNVEVTDKQMSSAQGQDFELDVLMDAATTPGQADTTIEN